MEELTESARQTLVSQGMVLGTLSMLNSLGLLLTGAALIIQASEFLHFTSLTHLAILEVACGGTSFASVGYIWWIVSAYRSRAMEIRSKYLDENMSKGLIALILPLFLTFSAFVVSAIFMLLKTETSSTYDLKSAMSLYGTDITRKMMVDKLQILLECCGSQSLLDWFLIDWQNADLEPGHHLDNATFSDWDSVPFSCCLPDAPPPCIHHQLKIFGVGSLYSSGCADKLDETVFLFVMVAMVLFFISGFFMGFIMYLSRKLQTSARSAVQKGDASAPGAWWLLTPAASRASSGSAGTPLIEQNKYADEDADMEEEEEYDDEEDDDFDTQSTKTMHQPRHDSWSMADYWCKQNRVIMSPVLVAHKKKRKKKNPPKTEWVAYQTRTKQPEIDSSEDWTRRANDASGSTSTTSFLTTSLPNNSTPDSRRSVSDTAVANLEVSQHFEHKFRPLYRS